MTVGEPLRHFEFR